MPKAGAPGATELQVTRLGAGPPVLLIHGSVVGPMRTWRHQLELGESWNLILPYRPGFGESPPLPRGDFESEAPGPLLDTTEALVAALEAPDRVRLEHAAAYEAFRAKFCPLDDGRAAARVIEALLG